MSSDYTASMLAAKYKAERDVARQEAERWKRDVDNRRVELCSWLGIDTGTGWSNAVAEMDKRLMPPGYEWPRYEDGEPVKIGDDVVGPDYGERINVHEITFYANGFAIYEQAGFGLWYENDNRFKRPKPDHIGADGLPIREGETAYRVDDGKEVKVLTVLPSGSVNTVVRGIGIGKEVWIDSHRLTHTKPEPPDSWERLEHDARELDISLDGENTDDYPRMSCVSDLVRRAKALAEKKED